MNKFILAATMTAAVALPSIVIAQGTTAPRTVLIIPPPGTVICRPIKASEKIDATMGTVQLKCRNVNVARIRTAITNIRAMMSSKNMTPAQSAQMQTSLNSVFQEYQPDIPGGVNNPSGY